MGTDGSLRVGDRKAELQLSSIVPSANRQAVATATFAEIPSPNPGLSSPRDLTSTIGFQAGSGAAHITAESTPAGPAKLAGGSPSDGPIRINNKLLSSTSVKVTIAGSSLI